MTDGVLIVNAEDMARHNAKLSDKGIHIPNCDEVEKDGRYYCFNCKLYFKHEYYVMEREVCKGCIDEWEETFGNEV